MNIHKFQLLQKKLYNSIYKLTNLNFPSTLSAFRQEWCPHFVLFPHIMVGARCDGCFFLLTL